MVAACLTCSSNVRTPSNAPAAGRKSYLSAGIASARLTRSCSTRSNCFWYMSVTGSTLLRRVERERDPEAFPFRARWKRLGQPRHVNGLHQPRAVAIDRKGRPALRVGLTRDLAAVDGGADGRVRHGPAVHEQLHGEGLSCAE